MGIIVLTAKTVAASLSVLCSRRIIMACILVLGLAIDGASTTRTLV